MEQTEDCMEKIREIMRLDHKTLYSLFYDIIYNDFIDRVKNRMEIPNNEFYKIIYDMHENLFHYLPFYMIEESIKDHGWKYYCDSVVVGGSWYKKISKDE